MSKEFIDKIKHLMDHGAISKPEQLNAIKGLPNSFIRLAVAGHPNTSAETLNHLCTDNNTSVRRAVAEHPNTHPQTLGYMRDNEKHPYIQKVARERLEK